MGNYRISDSTPLGAADLCTALFDYDPRSSYAAGGQRVVTLAGTTVDVGYPRATWTFSGLTVTQWETLLGIVGGYSGEVYVETRDDVDDWYEYRAIARLPEPQTLDRWTATYKDVAVELILVEVIP